MIKEIILGLSLSDKKRYNRHLILSGVGEIGQLKLKASSVLVIGAGGLGSPILQYLTAAGVGHIGIVDFDIVDESNLQRQVLFTEQDLGKSKAEVASKKLQKLNSHIKLTVFNTKLTATNGLKIFSDFDLVIDGSDNFSTRYLVNDLSIKSKIPLVYGSIYKFEGQVSVFNFNNGPSYRCLFPSPPNPNEVNNCSEIGVIGVLPGIVGTQQANEALKIILGVGEVLSGQLLTYNALSVEYSKFKFHKNQNIIDEIISDKFNIGEFDYDFFCGFTVNKEINISELKGILNNLDYQIIDLRDDWEIPKISALNLLKISPNNLIEKVELIDRSKKVVIACQNGMRSKSMISYLNSNFEIEKLINLKNGLSEY